MEDSGERGDNQWRTAPKEQDGCANTQGGVSLHRDEGPLCCSGRTGKGAKGIGREGSKSADGCGGMCKGCQSWAVSTSWCLLSL